MDKVNEERGSLAPLVRGHSFADAVTKWREAVAPNLSPATVRAMESHLRTDILPQFASASPVLLNDYRARKLAKAEGLEILGSVG